MIRRLSGKQVASHRSHTAIHLGRYALRCEQGLALYPFEAPDPKKDNPKAEGPGIVDVIQQQNGDHYEKITTYTTGYGAQTGLFLPEWGKLFVATRHQLTGQSGEILIYETK
jgi:hypothetical protein